MATRAAALKERLQRDEKVLIEKPSDPKRWAIYFIEAWGGSDQTMRILKGTPVLLTPDSNYVTGTPSEESTLTARPSTVGTWALLPKRSTDRHAGGPLLSTPTNGQAPSERPSERRRISTRYVSRTTRNASPALSKNWSVKSSQEPACASLFIRPIHYRRTRVTGIQGGICVR